MKNNIVINGIYKHFKGNYYLLVDIATNSETLEKYVVYRALYGENGLWIRPLSMFFEEVNKNNQTYRFEFQEINSIKNK